MLAIAKTLRALLLLDGLCVKLGLGCMLLLIKLLPDNLKAGD